LQAGDRGDLPHTCLTEGWRVDLNRPLNDLDQNLSALRVLCEGLHCSLSLNIAPAMTFFLLRDPQEKSPCQSACVCGKQTISVPLAKRARDE